MKKRENYWAIAYGIVLSLLLSIPYWVGYAAETDAWRFSGFVFAVEDGNSYIAKMLAGSAGSWLFQSPYSTMDQDGIVAFLPYILLGKLAAGSAIHEQLVVLYHLFRIVVTPFTVWATYRFLALFTRDPAWRKWGTIMATLGGGVGWVLVIIGNGLWFGSYPMDWISPEWFGFLAYFGTPHLILARGLMLISLTYYLVSPMCSRRAWYAGGCIAVAGIIHPLSLITIFAVIAVHQVAILIASKMRNSWSQIKRWALAAMKVVIIPLPIALYYVVKFTTDPYLRAWTDQNRIFSPHPVHALISYGLLLIPVLYGMKAILHSGRWSSLLFVAWGLAFPIFAYAPHNLQRRLPDGIWIAWIVLAVFGLNELRNLIQNRMILVRVFLIGLALPSTIMIFVSATRVASQPRMPIFRPSEEVAIFEWLNSNVARDSVVLSAFETGNALPAWAHCRVVLGHGPETANFKEIQTQVDRFYSGIMIEDEAAIFLTNHSIDYVFKGPHERALGDFDLMQSDSFELRFESGPYRLFERVE